MASFLRNSRPAALGSDHAFDELIGRLYRAGVSGVREVIEHIRLPERAKLAAFCWQRAHLYEVGLAIAEHCDEGSLLAELGRERGHALSVQSQERRHRRPETLRSYRPKITLAGFGLCAVRPDDDLIATPAAN